MHQSRFRSRNKDRTHTRTDTRSDSWASPTSLAWRRVFQSRVHNRERMGRYELEMLFPWIVVPMRLEVDLMKF